MRLLRQIGAATSTIIFAFVLATLSLVLIGIWAPGFLDQVLNFANSVERWLTESNLPVKYNVWVKFLLDEQQIVFLIFTVAARILIAIVLTLLGMLFGVNDER